MALGSPWWELAASGWADLAAVRAWLAGGADSHEELVAIGAALHAAAAEGSPEVTAELARAVDDVDLLQDDRSALWCAVFAGRADNAQALVAAGARPNLHMMGGWSPAILSLAGPTPDLFGGAGGAPQALLPSEQAAVAEARRLIPAIGDVSFAGTGLACVAEIDAAEAIQRLGGAVVEDIDVQELLDDPPYDDDLALVGATDVPGGCILVQPWGYAPSMPGVGKLLSAGTVCYSMYANPKSGNQGSIIQDGTVLGSDLHPGGGHPDGNDPPDEILLAYLYQHHAVAYCCAYAGLRLTDARAVTGQSDVWFELPADHYWS